MDMLIPDTTIYTILGYEIVNQDFLQWRDTFFVPERVKNNIHIHVLSAQTPLTDQYREHDSDTLRETRYLRNVTKEL
jgi:hypothetical protein